jgi:hypothetical protein
MNAYQRFLDFFEMRNKERLDGLNELYFSEMTPEERAKAFDHLLKMTESGGGEESINGLFIADAERAAPIVKNLLDEKKLNDRAQISAAWNLYRVHPDPNFLKIFTSLMSSPDRRVRARATYYVPAEMDADLIAALKGVIRTDTDSSTQINASNKLLECFGITRESVSKEQFSRYYRGIRSDDSEVKEATFELLDLMPG